MRAVLASCVVAVIVLLASVTVALAEEEYSHGKPTNVSATCFATSASVAWSPVSDNHLVGYDVYRRPSGESSFAKVNGAPVTLTVYSDSPLEGGTTYEYGVRAVYNDGHTSFLSDTSTCTTT